MNYVSVCSGIEAATVAWHPLGWRAVAFSEIEKFPCAVLAHHYPETPNLGDMTQFQRWPDAAVDVLVGGTPCQSFSVAGLRKGLADPRGNLMLTYLAIAARYRPEWLVWENVPGVLSSNGGRDFGALLGGLAELGYGFAYRILDAQHFGVPQRRRRVFVVGCLGNWRRAAAVLFERHGLQWHPAPRREAGKGITSRTARSVAIRGRDGTPQAELGDELANAILTPNGGRGGVGVGAILEQAPPVALCLNAGAMGRQDWESETLIPTIGGDFDVAHSLRADGFDASEDGTGSGTPLLVAFSCKDHGADAADTAPTLRAMGHSGSHANAGGQVAVAFAENSRAELRLCGGDGQVSAQLTTGGGKPGQGQPCIAFGWQNSSQQGASASASATPTLDKSKVPGIGIGSAVRRLTPRECEALQGFPSIRELLRIDVCFDHQNGSADVALSCLRWPSNASRADAARFQPSAGSAAAALSISQASRDPLAALRARLGSEVEPLEIRSRGRSIWSASSAGTSSLYLPFTQAASIAVAAVGRSQCLALEVRTGRAESLQLIRLSIQGLSGGQSVPTFGDGSEGSASGVMSGARPARFITSDLWRLVPNSASLTATSLCSVLAAISGCIPSETLPDSFSFEIDVEADYTAIPIRGKPAADGPRYKALGNSMAVPVMHWIGQRIDAVHSIKGSP